MSLYKNVVHWDFNLEVGDYVAWIRNPFSEYMMDPIFKVLYLYDDFTADLEVVRSTYLEVGSQYLNQTRDGLRRVKLTNIGSDFKYIKGE